MRLFCIVLSAFFHRDPLIQVYEYDRMDRICKMFGDGLYRVLIYNGQQQIVHILTQADTIRFVIGLKFDPLLKVYILNLATCLVRVCHLRCTVVVTRMFLVGHQLWLDILVFNWAQFPRRLHNTCLCGHLSNFHM